ncbi:MAG: hypothetical protein ABIR18_13205 [Chitinophagaceae bacterium]
MKIYSILLILVMVAAGSSCKRYEDIPGHEPPIKDKKWIVSTIAGSESGFADGPALSAKFNLNTDVAVASDGTIYVTDLINSRIRKIANGEVSTLAGNGDFSIIDGTGATATFKDPKNIAISTTGILYTTDFNDPRVRKISPFGDCTTYAGKETVGFADGRVFTAEFGNANSLAVDAVGNVYVSDFRNNRIRKISITGDVTTIAGSGVRGFADGNADAAQFASPTGIAIDQQNNLYVLDGGNLRIRKITPAGQVSTFAGSGRSGSADGNAGTAEFSQLYDVVVDSKGNLYVSENNYIRQITPQGTVSTIAGSRVAGYVDGEGPSARFDLPYGLGIDGNDNIYISDAVNRRIRKLSFE